jgi:hypothetical protein
MRGGGENGPTPHRKPSYTRGKALILTSTEKLAQIGFTSAAQWYEATGESRVTDASIALYFRPMFRSRAVWNLNELILGGDFARGIPWCTRSCKSRVLYAVLPVLPLRASLSFNSSRTSAARFFSLRLHGPHECTHELSVYLGRNRIHVDVLAAKELRASSTR